MRARHTRVALVGLSLGGALAATIAADDPELAALVLLAPYVDTPPLFRVLVRAAPAIGVVLPYVGGEGGAIDSRSRGARGGARVRRDDTAAGARARSRGGCRARVARARHGTDALRAVARGQPDHRGGRQARVRTRSARARRSSRC